MGIVLDAPLTCTVYQLPGINDEDNKYFQPNRLLHAILPEKWSASRESELTIISFFIMWPNATLKIVNEA